MRLTKSMYSSFTTACLGTVPVRSRFVFLFIVVHPRKNLDPSRQRQSFNCKRTVVRNVQSDFHRFTMDELSRPILIQIVVASLSRPSACNSFWSHRFRGHVKTQQGCSPPGSHKALFVFAETSVAEKQELPLMPPAHDPGSLPVADRL